MDQTPNINVLVSKGGKYYSLLDSGDGKRLEQIGQYRFVRPAVQAMWKPKLSEADWNAIHAAFIPNHSESGGKWQMKKALPESWNITYKFLHFKAFLANSRHVGFFPEQSPHWDWIYQKVSTNPKPIRVLNLFGYTGIASLAAAAAGATVTHVDASKKTLQIAKENQQLSQLQNSHIRWIMDDAIKFLRREQRRGAQYDGIILDPPKFGRGPKGEVWEFFDLLPMLLELCNQVLSKQPLFFLLTAYAIQASALTLYNTVSDFIKFPAGELTCGELMLEEQSAQRLLPMAIYVRWQNRAE
ncbi:MAG: class I SAM-dependent methyltransferase [Anaerolineales bacterium]